MMNTSACANNENGLKSTAVIEKYSSTKDKRETLATDHLSFTDESRDVKQKVHIRSRSGIFKDKPKNLPSKQTD